MPDTRLRRITAATTSAAQQFHGETGIPVFKFDVADFNACAEGVKKIESELGPIEVLVNNAGITRDSTMHRMSYEQWNAVIQTNLSSCFNMSRAVIDGMRSRGFGRIVNIGSINGQAGQYGQVNYAAAKSGIHGFTKALAQEGAARGITVNAVAPGYVDTEMVRAVPAEVLEKIIARIPVGRLGKAEDIARTVSVPGRRRRRLHHRLDAFGQRRPAHVLMRLAAGCRHPNPLPASGAREKMARAPRPA